MGFNIELTNGQDAELRKAGFYGLANDATEILFYLHPIIEYLASHNKNYTKAQYEKIDILKDVFKALYDGLDY